MIGDGRRSARIMLEHGRGLVIALALVASAVLGLVACGSSSADGDKSSASKRTSTSTSTSAAPPTATVPSTTPTPAPDDVNMRYARNTGDAISLGLSFDAPTLVSEVRALEGAALTTFPCNIPSPERALVVKARGELVVTSGLPADVTLRLTRPHGLYSTAILRFNGSPTCDDEVSFRQLAPGQKAQFTYWLLFADAITPIAPQGDTAQLARNGLIGVPVPFLSGELAALGEVTAWGSKVVGCPPGLFMLAAGPLSIDEINESISDRQSRNVTCTMLSTPG